MNTLITIAGYAVLVASLLLFAAMTISGAMIARKVMAAHRHIYKTTIVTQPDERNSV